MLMIRAQITGDDQCSSMGISVKARTPVLGLCRKLVEAGHDPDAPLEAYRGDVLALKVRTIGYGAHLGVEEGDKSPIFRKYHKPEV